MLASARSARAAAAGSSLARLTRLPVVSCSCSALRSACRRASVSRPTSYALAVAIRMAVPRKRRRLRGDLQQRIEHRLRDLQDARRRLVALLELDEAGRFLV